MSYYTPRKPTSNRTYGRSSQVIVTRRDLNSVAWADGYNCYIEAARLWETTETEAHMADQDAAYANFIKRKELEYENLSSESGAYEGNLTDSYPQQPYKPLPNRVAGRRRAGQKAFIAWLEGLQFGDLSTTVLPELMTLVGNIPYKLNDNGLISGKSVMNAFINDHKMLGIYVFLMLDTRSCYLDKQYKGSAKLYSSLVPLILYAVRLVKGVAYSAWDPEEIRCVVNNDLADAMLFDIPPDAWPSRDDIIAGRLQGLTFASGPNLGKVRNAVTTHKLYATTDTCFERTPSLFQVMLAQIWVAHPDNRTKYMVLDPLNWDRVPPPLIQTEVFSPSAYQSNEEAYEGIL